MSTTMIREPGRPTKPALSARNLMVRCRPEWLAWLGRVASESRVTQAEMVGAALAMLAEHYNLEPPPPRL